MFKKYTYQFVFRILLVRLLVFGLLNIFSSSVFGQEATMHSVLKNNQNPTEAITHNQLTSIMLGEQQRWADGTKIKLGLIKAGLEGSDIVARKVVNMDEQGFSKHWLALIFQGRASSPRYFNTEIELVAYVSTNQGAIGICKVEIAKERSILLIDGKTKF